MTIPEVFHSTANMWSAVAGVLVAVILAYFEKSLITVAVISAVAVFIVEGIMSASNLM